MAITVDLPPDLEAQLLAEANAKGIPLSEVVKAYLIRRPVQPSEPVQMSPEEWEKAWDELLDSLPDIPTLPDDAISRESIYTREDEQ